MSIVRKNLMNQQGYAPYCGGAMDPKSNCPMPRTRWDGEQFKCSCGWRSEFPADFIAEYKAKWNLEGKP